MKRKAWLSVLVALFVLVLFAVPGDTRNSSEYVLVSPSKAASAEVYRGNGYFHGIFVITDGANAVTMNVYDNTTNSGKQLIPTDWVIPTASTNRAQAFNCDPPAPVKAGIYVEVTCGGTMAYMVYYSKY